VALMHQGKEQSDLDRFDLDVANFVDQQAIEGEILLRTLVSEWSPTER